MSIKYYWAKFFKKIHGSAIKGSIIHNTSKVEQGSNILNVHMQKHSFCGYNCEISNALIGSFCSIANNVTIGGGMHPIEWVSTSPVFYEGRDSVKAKFSEHKRDSIKTINIGHDVWVGQNAIIKQGVNIGNGAIIGMGSVVTKDVPPYMIVGGIPAKKIRYRFNEETISFLQDIKWWEFTDKELNHIAKYFNNIDRFIKEYKNIKS